MKGKTGVSAVVTLLVLGLFVSAVAVQAQAEIPEDPSPSEVEVKPATGLFKVAVPGSVEIITDEGSEVREFSEGDIVVFTITGQYPDGSWQATGPEGKVRINGADGCNCWTEGVELSVDMEGSSAEPEEPAAESVDVTLVAPAGTFVGEEKGVRVAVYDLQYRGMGRDRLLLMGIRVDNLSSKEIHVNPLHCTIVALEGATFNHSWDTYSEISNHLDAVDVQPGAFAYGGIAFPMREGSGPRALVYSDFSRTITADLQQPLPDSVPESPAPTTATMYETVGLGGWELYVYKIHRQKQLWWSDGNPVTAAGIFALVRLKVTNLTGSPATMDSSFELLVHDDRMRILKHEDGDLSTRHTAHRVVSNHADTLDDIQPGAPEWPVLLCFDVAEDSQELWLDIETRDGTERASIYLSPCQSETERICEGRFIDATPKD